MRKLLEHHLPTAILWVTGPFAFGAPEVPTVDELRRRARERTGGLNDVVKDLREAANEMNARLASGLAGLSVLLLGVTGLFSA